MPISNLYALLTDGYNYSLLHKAKEPDAKPAEKSIFSDPGYPSPPCGAHASRACLLIAGCIRFPVKAVNPLYIVRIYRRVNRQSVYDGRIRVIGQ
ncbi:MAG: hypothetical protein K0Q94_5728 [Paenibacillus sp.]|nr:hypothetical protein [Paenibacillus sp.]